MRIETERLVITEFTMERCGFVKEFEGIGPYQGAELPICRYRFTL